jgi:chaperone BCS1
MIKRDPAGGAMLVPGPGLHPIKWLEKRLMINIAMEAPPQGSYNGDKKQTVNVQVYGRKGRDTLQALLDHLIAMNVSRKGMRIYANQGPRWEEVTLVEDPRPLSSLVFPDGFFEGIRRDLEKFMDSKDEYRKRGLPWRRGYLFSGVPGTGKSSLIEAIAGHLEMNVYLMSIKGAGERDVLQLLSDIEEKKALVVIEDIDCAMDSRVEKVREAEGTPKPKAGIGRNEPDWGDPDEVFEKAMSSKRTPTLAGLLNSLDGIGAPQGRILFVTTNFPDRLDPALTRPGRLDVKIDFPLLTEQTANHLYDLLGDLSKISREDFLLAAVGRSPADGRGILLQDDLLLKVVDAPIVLKGKGVGPGSSLIGRA